MYHYVKMSSKFIGGNVEHLDEEELFERLESFTSSGEISLIVDDPETLEEIGIDPDDIETVIIEK